MSPLRVKTISAPLAPGATIGILGGGQLGRMLAQAAAQLGFRTHIYSDETHPCAFDVASSHTSSRYDDEKALNVFAQSCDVVTFEFENVPDETVRFIEGHVPVAPNGRALGLLQDRLAEKNFVAGLGIPTAPFRNVESETEAREAFAALGGGPAILKTRRLGYDGKGQRKIASADSCVRAFLDFGAPSILEGFVSFEYEASVIAARARDGAFAAYDPPKNDHENHILRRSTVPAPLDQARAHEAVAMAKTIAEALDYAGVLGVELFVTKTGLVVNEIAPRVHNSGHWTLDACLVSQFEQHIRAVAGWPLNDAARHSNAVMENIIGTEADAFASFAKNPAGLHLYGKGEARPGRKMGHITTLTPKA